MSSSAALRRLGPITGAALVLAALGFAGWRVEGFGPAGDAVDWEEASVRDCPLMAQSLHALRMGAPDGPPLIGRSAAPGPCVWSRWGLNPGRLTRAEFALATAGDRHNNGYIHHVSVSRPRYSLLHLRAAVAVGDYYGWEGGDGHVCYFWRGLRGWRLQSCRRSWIA